MYWWIIGWVLFLILYVIVDHRVFVISPIKPLQCILISHNISYYITTEKILIELKHNTKVKFKETDLFRVYQSIDLVSCVFWCVMCAYHMLNLLILPNAHHTIIVSLNTDLDQDHTLCQWKFFSMRVIQSLNMRLYSN